MRFDLVDLQLFIAIAETRSITAGAGRVHLALASASERIKGLELALGVALLKRGRRGVELTSAGESLLDHARVVIHNVEALQGDLASFASGARASVHLLANTSGLSEYLPKALATFLAAYPRISVDVEERESGDIARAIAAGAADLGLAAEHALPEGIERITFSEDRLVLVVPRQDELANRRQVDFGRSGQPRFRRSDHLERVACPCQRPCGEARRPAALPRPAEQFRCHRPDGGGRHRRCRDAGSGGAPFRGRIKIGGVRIRDDWANRRLVICARSFKALAKPAQQLVEHLRKAAR